MTRQSQREIRFGMIALVITGLCFTVSVLLRGPLPADAAAAMQMARTPNFMPSVMIGLIGLVFAPFGTFGLYRYLTLRSDSLIPFLAAILGPLGLVFVLPLIVFLGVNVPVIAQLYSQGNQEVLAVYKATFSSPFGLGLIGVTSLAGLIGTLLFTIAIWRDAMLPKWLAVAFAVKNLLLTFSGPGFYPTEVLGCVMALAVACVMAWKVWPVTAAEKAVMPPLATDLARGETH